MKRRDFFKQSALASSSMMVPMFLKGFQPNKFYKTRDKKILVVIQLSGGNDGLNTVVPFQNDIYYQNRPTIAIKKSDVLTLTDDLGFNPAMVAMKSMYENGDLTILNHVGYPNPDRSHFRSMDIWHTGSNADTYWSSGWLGRYLDNVCDGCSKPYSALEFDDTLSLALKGNEKSGFAMSQAKQLKRTTDNKFLKKLATNFQDQGEQDSHLSFLYKTMIDTQSSTSYLLEQSKVFSSKREYPQTPFGKDLKQIAELITADTDTRIYYSSLTGFDTHANQILMQSRLLKQLSDGLEAFVADLKENKLFNETLIMVFSEFGRRVGQNASNGTDHGAANNLFLLSGSLKKPGFFNPKLDLSKLEEGDVSHSIDFRKVYATTLDSWLEDGNSKMVLEGSFDKLDLI